MLHSTDQILIYADWFLNLPYIAEAFRWEYKELSRHLHSLSYVLLQNICSL
jgi:hypothetical protein